MGQVFTQVQHIFYDFDSNENKRKVPTYVDKFPQDFQPENRDRLTSLEESLEEDRKLHARHLRSVIMGRVNDGCSWIYSDHSIEVIEQVSKELSELGWECNIEQKEGFRTKITFEQPRAK